MKFLLAHFYSLSRSFGQPFLTTSTDPTNLVSVKLVLPQNMSREGLL